MPFCNGMGGCCSDSTSGVVASSLFENMSSEELLLLPSLSVLPKGPIFFFLKHLWQKQKVLARQSFQDYSNCSSCTLNILLREFKFERFIGIMSRCSGTMGVLTLLVVGVRFVDYEDSR